MGVKRTETIARGGEGVEEGLVEFDPDDPEGE
jgi:hypothetical protein